MTKVAIVATRLTAKLSKTGLGPNSTGKSREISISAIRAQSWAIRRQRPPITSSSLPSAASRREWRTA